MSDQDPLLTDLENAERANRHLASCQACDALLAMTGEVQAASDRAISGTIGAQKLSKILRSHGFEVGRRAIDRHRAEGHQPV